MVLCSLIYCNSCNLYFCNLYPCLYALVGEIKWIYLSFIYLFIGLCCSPNFRISPTYVSSFHLLVGFVRLRPSDWQSACTRSQPASLTFYTLFIIIIIILKRMKRIIIKIEFHNFVFFWSNRYFKPYLTNSWYVFLTCNDIFGDLNHLSFAHCSLKNDVRFN